MHKSPNLVKIARLELKQAGILAARDRNAIKGRI